MEVNCRLWRFQHWPTCSSTRWEYGSFPFRNAKVTAEESASRIPMKLAKKTMDYAHKPKPKLVSVATERSRFQRQNCSSAPRPEDHACVRDREASRLLWSGREGGREHLRAGRFWRTPKGTKICLLAWEGSKIKTDSGTLLAWAWGSGAGAERHNTKAWGHGHTGCKLQSAASS